MGYAEWKEKFVDTGFTKGLSSGKIGDMDSTTTITGIKQIDYNNEDDVKKEIASFCEKFAYADIEHALVISPDGKAYQLSGNTGKVNIEIIGKDELRHSIVIHNHPVESGDLSGDSFSIDDLYSSIIYDLRKLCLVSGERRNAFLFTKQHSKTDVYNAWIYAKNNIFVEGSQIIEFLQEEILKKLNEDLEGFIFYEEF